MPNARVWSAKRCQLVERLKRYEVSAALLIPASRLCHQSIGLAARAIESAGIPTMMLAVERDIVERVHPPRAAFYQGQIGSVVGQQIGPSIKEEFWMKRCAGLSQWANQYEQAGRGMESLVEAARGER